MLTRKCQWILMALLATSLAAPVQTWALGLDELDVTSALNERFAGTIELLDAQGLQPSEIVVSMASREDFERVGVERFFYLTNLKFAVENENGSAVVKVSSTQPIAEPYLNFIVEVLWPRGRLLKEYTVLLDPPTFSQVAAPAVQAPAQPAPRASQQPAQRPAPANAGTRVDLQPRSSTRPPAPRAPVDGLMTTRDDTLWQIASRTLPSDRVSVNQQMLAIQRKNPQAFLRGNINLLKAGYVLDIPSEEDALGINTSAAIQEVAAQSQAWRSDDNNDQLASTVPAATALDDRQPQTRSAVDATEATAQNDSATDQGQGQVRILASSGELASGTASGEDPSVNVLLGEKETLSRQVDELTYQLDREKEIAANEVTVRDRQLEVKNQELAAMAERLRKLEEQAAEAPQNQNQSPNTTSPDTPWWMSPMVLFGVIVLLILFLAVVLMRLRSARAEQAAFENEFFDEPADETVVAAAPAGVTEASEVYDDEEADDEARGVVESFIGDLAEVEDRDHLALTDEESASDIEQTQPSADGAQSDSGKTGDAIGEAEIYIAYGRYGQAANLLTSVLNNEPERWDVRLKLLEVFVESSDEAAFSEQAQYILDHCDDEEVLMACRDFGAQFDSSVVNLSDDDSAQDAQYSAEEDTLELDLDELDSIETASTDQEGRADLSSDNELEDILDDTDAVEENPDIEFELEFDDADNVTTEDDTDREKGAGDELGGDLGIDFDPDRAPLDEAAGSTSEDAVELDLDDQEAEEEQTLNFESETPDSGDDFEFDSLEEGDINGTKLDLAEAYIDMGDADGAQDILKEVIEEGSPDQQEKAQSMLDKMNG